jgi:hypothetical protein
MSLQDDIVEHEQWQQQCELHELPLPCKQCERARAYLRAYAWFDRPKASATSEPQFSATDKAWLKKFRITTE